VNVGPQTAMNDMVERFGIPNSGVCRNWQTDLSRTESLHISYQRRRSLFCFGALTCWHNYLFDTPSLH